MGWAEKRIEEYKQGKNAAWLERRVLEHANPINLALTAIGVVMLITGLWIHDWVLIIVAAALHFLGHLYCWSRKI